jgi:hypothetical protein
MGIVCEAAGSSAGKTTLDLSSDPAELEAMSRTAATVHALQKKAAEIRGSVEPLMKHQKNLSAQQKEKATELLYLADEAEGKAKQMAETLHGPRDRANAALKAQVRVGSLLHAGVVLRCLGFETTANTSLRGPMRIGLRLGNGEPLFVVYDGHNKPVTGLPATRSPDAGLMAQLRAAGESSN